MLDYTLTINGVDFTDKIERDSYTTKKIPVYSQSIVTMDGITHVTNLRNKSEISFSLNPQNATDTATLCTALLTMPCEVYCFSLQTQVYELKNMMIDSQSAEYLSRCLYRGERWNQMDSITLTEL
jgi:hypothetical protein